MVTVEYYSVLKNENAVMYDNVEELKNIVLSEISQAEKENYCAFSLGYGEQNNQT
jgi:hypothetical protein